MSTPTGADDDDQSFAHVLNNLSGGPWRLGWPRKGLKRPPVPEQPVVVVRRPAPEPARSEEWGEPAVPASVVRPYTWTGGRTSSIFNLEVETLVSTSEHGRDMAVLTSEEHRAVTALCRHPQSVAEVAALLSLPLGVARVLLGDMASLGLIMVHRTANSSGDTPELDLMERVLSGLRRL